MVTDEMVDKAADEMARQDIMFANCDRGWQKRTIRAALEAALSAAEPVAAMTTDYLGCEYVSSDVANIENIAAAGSNGPTEVVYLYAAPPAPSVKALEWKSYREPGQSARIKAVHPFGEYRIIDNSRDGELWSPELGGVNVTFDGWDEAKAAAQADYEARIRSTLSAQVQDVAGWMRLDNAFSNFINGYGDPYEPKKAHEAETAKNLKELYEAFMAYRSTSTSAREDAYRWQTIDTAPKDGEWCLVHYNDECAPIITFYDDECFSGWAHQDRMGGNEPTHWMPLPAAPAKQEG